MSISNSIRIPFSSFFILYIILVSCSTIHKSDFHNHYYSSDYENKSFKNVSMDICIPKTKYEYNTGIDSNTISMQINFDTTFRKFFPDRIKLFSSVIETGWIFYETNYESDPILYDKLSNDGNYLYSVSMPDSLSFFQIRSKSDFLFVIHYITFAGNSPTQQNNSSNIKKGYESIITVNYSIWNSKNSDLVAIDQVTTKMSFHRLGDRWPYRGVILKSAYEIFERLPMFNK